MAIPSSNTAIGIPMITATAIRTANTRKAKASKGPNEESILDTIGSELIDVRRSACHQAVVVGPDVPHANVVAHRTPTVLVRAGPPLGRLENST